MNSSTSSSRARRALATVLGFILFLVIFDRVLFFLISRSESNIMGDASFVPQFKDFTKDKQFSTLILGTSRTYEGIHPHYLSKNLDQSAYKEAQFGKGPKYNYIFYQFFKQYAGTPRVLIYGVDYFIFNVKSRPRWLYRFDTSLWEPKNYLGPHLMLARYKSEIDDFVNYSLERFTHLLGSDKNGGPALDFVKLQDYIGVNLKKKDIVSDRPRRWAKYSYRRYPGREGEYFIKLIEECDRDGVKVVLVLLPDYIGTYFTNFRKKLFVKNIEEITERFRNVYIYNYNLPDKFPLENAKLFLNGGYGQTNSHLSKAGARRLNRLLIRDIRHHYN